MSISVVNPEQYSSQLEEKKQHIAQLFSEFNLPAVEVFESPREHYRMRSEFRVWHDDDDLYYVMFAKGNKHERIRIVECPMVSKRIHDVMFALLDAIKWNGMNQVT